MMRPSLSRFSLRYSILVWVAGAVLGWTVAITSGYFAVRMGDQVVAERSGATAPTTQTAAPDPKVPLTDDEIRKMQEIAPAAGPRR